MVARRVQGVIPGQSTGLVAWGRRLLGGRGHPPLGEHQAWSPGAPAPCAAEAWASGAGSRPRPGGSFLALAFGAFRPRTAAEPGQLCRGGTCLTGPGGHLVLAGKEAAAQNPPPIQIKTSIYAVLGGFESKPCWTRCWLKASVGHCPFVWRKRGGSGAWRRAGPVGGCGRCRRELVLAPASAGIGTSVRSHPQNCAIIGRAS